MVPEAAMFALARNLAALRDDIEDPEVALFLVDQLLADALLEMEEKGVACMDISLWRGPLCGRHLRVTQAY